MTLKKNQFKGDRVSWLRNSIIFQVLQAISSRHANSQDDSASTNKYFNDDDNYPDDGGGAASNKHKKDAEITIDLLITNIQEVAIDTAPSVNTGTNPPPSATGTGPVTDNISHITQHILNLLCSRQKLPQNMHIEINLTNFETSHGIPNIIGTASVINHNNYSMITLTFSYELETGITVGQIISVTNSLDFVTETYLTQLEVPEPPSLNIIAVTNLLVFVTEMCQIQLEVPGPPSLNILPVTFTPCNYSYYSGVIRPYISPDQ